MLCQKELSLDEIHKVTLETLKIIISICERMKINYFLAYGSLLGAVRHGGFIPWDDDCDLIMTRGDYEKFISYCKENEDSLKPFCIMDESSVADYPYGIARFCNLKYRMESTLKTDIDMGVFIDIYPFDPVSDFWVENRTLALRRLMFWHKLIDQRLVGKFSPSSKGALVSLVKFAVYLSSKLFSVSFCLNRMKKIQEKFSKGTCNYVECFWTTVFKPIPKECLDSFEELWFEDVKVKVPAHYRKALENWYGDYMALPPVNKRVPTHEYCVYLRDGDR